LLLLKPYAKKGEELWDWKNAKWWQKKYKTYAGTLRHYHRLEYKARGDFPKHQKIIKMIGHYEKLHESLERRADRAQLPKYYRYYP
jgi:hypothetical protein